MTEKKEKIYRVAMRLCRMWGISETLTQDLRPYESPKDGSVLLENEKTVLEWAEEFTGLQKSDRDLSDFFEGKIRQIQKAQEEEEEKLPFPEDL